MNVMIYAMRGDERLSAIIETQADNAQQAIAQVVGREARSIYWYSITYRHNLGFLNNAVIFSYEVMQ